jgi:2-amino-4-hydroxy-6-hydroxymethyldihydropteridine diphosphokinase
MTGPTRRVAFSLGANLGARRDALQGAVDLLAGTGLLRSVQVSSVYETDPVGGPPGQPAYLNAVVCASSSAAALELLGLAYRAELAFGRTREVRWGARTLDVDLLTVGDCRSDDAGLTLPHPRAHQRAFVLVPWYEVDPDAQLPGHGSVRGLARRLAAAAGDGAVRLVGSPLRVPG